MSIGNILKEKREERKLSVAQISSVIRINKKYLQALEDENFLLLPSLVYAKGFLKAYSEYLGLDPKGLLSELSEYFRNIDEGRRAIVPAPKGRKNIPMPKMPDMNFELKMPRFPKIDLSRFEFRYSHAETSANAKAPCICQSVRRCQNSREPLCRRSILISSNMRQCSRYS